MKMKISKKIKISNKIEISRKIKISNKIEISNKIRNDRKALKVRNNGKEVEVKRITNNRKETNFIIDRKVIQIN